MAKTVSARRPGPVADAIVNAVRAIEWAEEPRSRWHRARAYTNAVQALRYAETHGPSNEQAHEIAGLWVRVEEAWGAVREISSPD